MLQMVGSVWFFPTGSALQSVADWQQNLGSGAHLEGANLLSYDHVAGDYTYLASDLTPAYNNTSYDETGEGGKVSSVLRSLVYLHQEDRLVLFDRVSSTEPGFKKKWLLHTVNKPDMSNLKVVVGSAENGILQSNASIVRVRNGEGRLQIQRVLPENATIRLVGGKDYQFYVEADGDDSALDGVNFSGGAAFKPWFDIGSWRVEVQPTREQTDDEFLISLLPAIGEFRTETLRPLEVGNSARAVYDKYAIYVFVKKLRDTQLSFSTLSTHKKVYFFGLPARRRVDVKFVDKSSSVKSNAQGVIVLPLLDAAGSGKRIVASW